VVTDTPRGDQSLQGRRFDFGTVMVEKDRRQCAVCACSIDPFKGIKVLALEICYIRVSRLNELLVFNRCRM
jgi:hypothetical protein